MSMHLQEDLLTRVSLGATGVQAGRPWFWPEETVCICWAATNLRGDSYIEVDETEHQRVPVPSGCGRRRSRLRAYAPTTVWAGVACPR